MGKKNQTAPASFEEALEELEAILREIESGKVSLEDSLVKYERGNFLIQHCRGILNSAEKRIEEITRNADGTTSTAPMQQPSGED